VIKKLIIMASLQKKVAAKILKVGQSKVWLDPTKTKEIEAAITRADIRKLISQHMIKAKKGKLPMPKQKKRRQRGRGSKKGSTFAKYTAKKRWIATVRPLRVMLKELRAEKQIDKPTYRKLYLQVKGGMFRSKSHLKIYLEQHGIIKKK
jgi:large subunit ribosomal protein L19e